MLRLAGLSGNVPWAIPLLDSTNDPRDRTFGIRHYGVRFYFARGGGVRRNTGCAGTCSVTSARREEGWGEGWKAGGRRNRLRLLCAARFRNLTAVTADNWYVRPREVLCGEEYCPMRTILHTCLFGRV